MAPNLHDLFSNRLLTYHIAPYLTLSSICILIRTSKTLRALLIGNGSLYHYLDLQEDVVKMTAKMMKADDTDDYEFENVKSAILTGEAAPSGKDRSEGCESSFAAPSDRFDVTAHVHVTSLGFLPRYNLDELGKYARLILFAHKYYSAGNEGNRTWRKAMKEASQRAAEAQAFPEKYRYCRDTSDDSVILFNQKNFIKLIIHVNLAEKGCVARLSKQPRVDADPLVAHVHTLVLDGIDLGPTFITHDIMLLVGKRKIPMKLLSLRETGCSGGDGLLDFEVFLENCTRPRSSSDSDERTSQNHAAAPVLGIYLFGKRSSTTRIKTQAKIPRAATASRSTYINASEERGSANSNDKGVMSAVGAQLGSEIFEQLQPSSTKDDVMNSSDAAAAAAAASLPDNDWYRSSGEIDIDVSCDGWPEIFDEFPIRANAETSSPRLNIAFDAVLCRGPRHDRAWVDAVAAAVATRSSSNFCSSAGEAGEEETKTTTTATVNPCFSYLPPKIATVALGPSGCVECGTSPEGPASFPESPISHLPLLSPLPRFGGSVRTAQKPPPPSTPPSQRSSSDAVPNPNPRLIVRCKSCLKGRWCEQCNRWWCENCYAGQNEPSSSSSSSASSSATTATPVRTNTTTTAAAAAAAQTAAQKAAIVCGSHSSSVKVAMGFCVERCLVPEMMNGAGSAGMWG